MPITVAFTITSAAALIVHSIYLQRTFANRRAQQVAKVNGDRSRIANAFFFMETTRFGINLCFFIAGVGLALHLREFGYLLAAPPVLSILSSSFALRGIR